MPQKDLLLTCEEIGILSKWIIGEGYITYDNQELHIVINKILKTDTDNELDRKSSLPTQGSGESR